MPGELGVWICHQVAQRQLLELQHFAWQRIGRSKRSDAKRELKFRLM